MAFAKAGICIVADVFTLFRRKQMNIIVAGIE
jgi:hypothetical protein